MKNGLRLPTAISSERHSTGHPGNIVAEIKWTTGKKVSDSLFDRKSLGLIPPAEDVVFGVPDFEKLEAMQILEAIDSSTQE
ncbi:hypothetical protein [Crateriforma conspicua]|uniref:hypothetical protein n=1 Tax=Crateriforma TaxID=2714592 RepID=UPI0011B7D525|nr:hypothetical protein [Crateriforma conspicua]